MFTDEGGESRQGWRKVAVATPSAATATLRDCESAGQKEFSHPRDAREAQAGVATATFRHPRHPRTNITDACAHGWVEPGIGGRLECCDCGLHSKWLLEDLEQRRTAR